MHHPGDQKGDHEMQTVKRGEGSKHSGPDPATNPFGGIRQAADPVFDIAKRTGPATARIDEIPTRSRPEKSVRGSRRRKTKKRKPLPLHASCGQSDAAPGTPFFLDLSTRSHVTFCLKHQHQGVQLLHIAQLHGDHQTIKVGLSVSKLKIADIGLFSPINVQIRPSTPASFPIVRSSVAP